MQHHKGAEHVNILPDIFSFVITLFYPIAFYLKGSTCRQRLIALEKEGLKKKSQANRGSSDQTWNCRDIGESTAAIMVQDKIYSMEAWR